MSYVPINGLRMLAIESSLLLATAILSYLFFRFVRWSFPRWRWLDAIISNQARAVLFVIAVALVGRALLLPWVGVPQPRIDDEYSNLLMGDTFAHFRLANPTPAAWPHFETFHVNMVPTYHSKYPVAQGVMLGIGEIVFHQPWAGVYLSTALMCGAICWALQAFVPPGWSLLGALLATVRMAFFSYWMNSYWGGAVAAIGGCLLLGALPRLAGGQVKSKDAALAGIGIVLLANTRPYEGLVMSVAVVVALLCWRRLLHRNLTGLISLRCVVPLLLVCGTAALLDGYYNFRVTGNALRMPYQTYFQQYQINPPWIILSGSKVPSYRHAYIENTWREQYSEYWENRTSPLHNFRDAYAVFAFFCPALYLFPLALGVLLAGSYRFWGAVGIYSFTWAGLLIESNKAPHYIAVSAALLPLLVIYGFRLLRIIGGRFGPLLVLTLAMLFCLQGRASEQGRSYETRGRRVVSTRMMALEMATKVSGSHLILVRYSPDHVDKSDGCVYNAANIDAARVVWAMDMGAEKNRELIDYYRGGRRIWLYQPDSDPTKLIPYQYED